MYMPLIHESNDAMIGRNFYVNTAVVHFGIKFGLTDSALLLSANFLKRTEVVHRW